MAKKLVIVESPAKARTIGRVLGRGYEAKASMGHVRDIPKRQMGVDVESGTFEPTYRVMPDKRKVVSELAKASKSADLVYLATDPDREGEAISWHLMHAAKIDAKKVRRVVFHEITDGAVREAFDNPRDLDHHLVDAQQARRVIDRLVGYELSPVLWKKVRRGLSAGRVQSVALRLIVDRERDIQAFVPREYWSIEASLAKRPQNGRQTAFKAELKNLKAKRGDIKIGNQEEAQAIAQDLDGAMYQVGKVTQKERRSRPAAPFITSTLQQEAWRKLRFTALRTMAVAQQLYEGISVGDEGSMGLITYMRTDSTTVASTARTEANAYIKRRFGPEYAPKSARVYTKKVKGAQEAHEAIRPTSILREPEKVRSSLTSDQARLYDLIWRRMLASQMADAVFDATSVSIDAGSVRSDAIYEFRAAGSVLKFPGFRVLYFEDTDEATVGGKKELPDLPKLANEDLLDCLDLLQEQHFTQPPPRYTEASLVRALEEQGIGRPSTYAPIIATVLNRDYVHKDKGRFVPSKLGTAVSNLLTANFPDIMDVGFTARVEEDLDDIANGEKTWTPVIRDLYGPFSKSVQEAIENAPRVPRDQIDEETDEVCDECSRPMVIKSGRFGRFLSCSGFPDCRTSRPLMARIGVDCPECGSDLVERERKQKGKGSRRFYGCSGYPNCTFASNRKPLPEPCPECGKTLVAAGRARARCLGCSYAGPVPESEPELAEATA
jgi:DNA topoisomerase-1